jgi:hypothetical protein
MGRHRLAIIGTSFLAATVLLGTAPAGASGLSVKVSPAKGLTNGKVVAITGKGLGKSAHGSTGTWFASECTAAVIGKLSPADASHCAISTAKALTVSAKGTFSTKFKVLTGTVGDGQCGVPGSLTCVIGVGTATGQGTVIKITFKKAAGTKT